METDGDRWRQMEIDGERWREMEIEGDRGIVASRAGSRHAVAMWAAHTRLRRGDRGSDSAELLLCAQLGRRGEEHVEDV
eukprot:5643295-Prymnesium_polylepis.1